jgi:hypothetical protein
MKAPDEIANDVTAMPNTTISGERMPRDSMTATFATEKTSAPPSIVERVAANRRERNNSDRHIYQNE